MAHSNQTMRPNPKVFANWLETEALEALAAELAGEPIAGLRPWQAQFIEQQTRFRGRMRRRFPNDQLWLWTDRSLSQASDWWSASYKASLFPREATVLDACCGAGVDSIALASRGKVVGIDNCWETLAVAQANAVGQLGSNNRFTPICGVYPDDAPRDIPWMHADPDRRPPDKSSIDRKTLKADSFLPPLDTLLEHASHIQGAVIKIAPSTVFSDRCYDQVSNLAQRVWLGVYGECRQQLLLCGATQSDSNSHKRRVVLCHPQHAEFSGDAQQSKDWTESPDQFVYDLHPALFASELHLSWADEQNLVPLGSELGYFTGNAFIKSPFAQAFEVVDVLAWDDRKMRKWLRQNDAGIIDVKSRNVRLDAAHFQRRYSNLDGNQPFSLLVTQLGRRVRAIACRRITANTNC